MLRSLFVPAFLAAAVAIVPAVAAAAPHKPVCLGDTVVWENTSSHVYHLPGDQYYGNTKRGKYACKRDADAAGYHAPGGGSTSSSSRSMGRMTGRKHRGASSVPSPEPT